LRASPLVAARRNARQIRFENLAAWTCEVVSGMFTLGGWWGVGWQEKIIVQNGGRGLVKPKNQQVVLAP